MAVNTVARMNPTRRKTPTRMERVNRRGDIAAS
jgi:hypothetical protein